MANDEKFTFFYHGPLCQWHRSTFVVDGVRYVTAEQYMMAEKARLFGDQKTLDLILEAQNPQDQKRLGRMVKGFNQKIWESKAREIVRRGSVAKFSQNPGLLSALARSAGTTLVEASPFDHIWGIALAENDPRALSRSTWRGTNWLGEVLTSVRRELVGS